MHKIKLLMVDKFKFSLRIVCVTVLVANLIGCSSNYKSQVKFNPLEPIRVAVLPFSQIDKSGHVVMDDHSLLIDQLQVSSSDPMEAPALFIRKLVISELAKTSLDLVSPALIDAKLSHSGFANDNLGFDIDLIEKTPAQKLCSEVLDCDAVLIGHLTEWDRSYYALQSVSSVGIELKMVSARDGKVLFESKATDAESRGLSKGPTGFSDLVIEPLKGLDPEIISDLTRTMVTKMLQPLFVSNRPEFLASPPPSIFASAHSSHDSKIHDKLSVVLLGSPGLSASFSIGNVISGNPMGERDAGHYIGEYFPLSTDNFKNQPVTVFLTDRFGRTTTQTIGRQKVSLVAK